MQKQINIIGAGLAGSECAWQLANLGYKVNLYEMRPKTRTGAHKTDNYAELVCSNSFRSNDHYFNAVGLLHWELQELDSLIMQSAIENQLPAGGALAVDREKFSEFISQKITDHENINIINQRVDKLNHDDINIIATGPLTHDVLRTEIEDITGKDNYAFFDAIAPIIYENSIDMNVAWRQSRYDKKSILNPIEQSSDENKVTEKDDDKIADKDSEKQFPTEFQGDYINCPMSKKEYDFFLFALKSSEKVEFKEFEQNTPYFNACLPIEVMAERGDQTLLYGPMKPVGLTNPHKEEQPYAVVQLRQDNKLGTLYNMVGFQTKMTYGAQKDVLRLIPGLEKCVFARHGGIHRNGFIHSPTLLNRDFSLDTDDNLFFAGQITGCEGYVESTAIGLLTAIYIDQKLKNKEFVQAPATSSLGALANHIIDGHIPGQEKVNFQPMNVNFGLFPPLEIPKKAFVKPPQTDKILSRQAFKKRVKNYNLTLRAKSDFTQWKEQIKK